MNYQSSSNYFPIENPFINYFLWFYTALDWASNSEKPRVLCTTIPRPRVQSRGMAGWFLGSSGTL
jgi:hypothetical protein